MSPTLPTLMRWAPPTSYADVLAHLARTPRPSRHAACLNPRCTSGAEVAWGRGRPQLFCGDSCRHAFDHQRSRLLQELGSLEEALMSLSGSVREARALEAEVAQRRWLLLRYPEVTRGSASRSVDTGRADGRRGRR